MHRLLKCIYVLSFVTATLGCQFYSDSDDNTFKNLKTTNYMTDQFIMFPNNKNGPKAPASFTLTLSGNTYTFKQIEYIPSIKASLFEIKVVGSFKLNDVIEGVNKKFPKYIVEKNKLLSTSSEIIQHSITYHPGQWALYNKGQRTPSNTNAIFDSDIDGLESMSQQPFYGKSGQEKVRVAVIDTGIDYTHKALKHRIWYNKGEIPQNGIDDDGNGFKDDVHGWNTATDHWMNIDEHGHGTHVAGIIASDSSDFLPVKGLALYAQIVPIKVTQGRTKKGTSYDLLQGIDYALQLKVDVINISMGIKGRVLSFDRILEAGYKDVFIAASAGNDGVNIDNSIYYPCSHPAVFCVGAINEEGNLWSGSNYSYDFDYVSAGVNIAAPGERILSTHRGGYEYLTGTSMASPYVAATAAILKGMRPNESVQNIRTRIFQSADILESLKGKVRGKRSLNTYRAMFQNVELDTTSNAYCEENKRKKNIPYANSNELNIDGLTKKNAYTICTPKQLVAINANDKNNYFLLKANVDWSELPKLNKHPIGAQPYFKFNGNFDGNGFQIRNLFTNHPHSGGLFASLGDESIIENLYLTNVDVSGNEVGAITGNSSGHIRNVQVEGRVEGSIAGGLVGKAPKRSIFESVSFEGIVKGDVYTGGILGYAPYVTTIDKAIVSIYLEGTGISGGLAGYIGHGGGTIQSSYANVQAGHVPGLKQTGGLVGMTHCRLTILNSYSQGLFEGLNKSAGIIGEAFNVQIENSYTDVIFKGGSQNRSFIAHVDDKNKRRLGSREVYTCTNGDSPGRPTKVMKSYYLKARNISGGAFGRGLEGFMFKDKTYFTSWFSTNSPWGFSKNQGPVLIGPPRTNGAIEKWVITKKIK